MAEKKKYEENNLPATSEISKQERQEFVRMRMQLLDHSSEDDILFSAIVQLRIQMETFLETAEDFIPFGHFLGKYCKLFGRKQKDIAEELAIHPTQLNRLINERQQPNSELTYRLEAHSGDLIPALWWFRLMHRTQEHELLNNAEARKMEASKVTNRFRFG